MNAKGVIMGVRFPNQQERPDFGFMQQANTPQQPDPQQEASQPLQQPDLRQAEEPGQEDAILEAQEPQTPLQQAPAERAAADAGAQTPGSIIDILA
jgi:hypothetical protein